MSDTEVVPLSELVAEALAALESRGPAGLEDVLRAHPDRASALLERLGSLRGVGLLGSPESAAEALPERLGPFRLRARLGGGGMGVVLLAEEPRLARLVALKVVRPDQLLFDGARARFEREAQAVAKLAHPSIVPLFSVGEDGGVPWFAMEFVRGATLAEVIAELRPRGVSGLRGEDLWQTVAQLEARRAREHGLEPAALSAPEISGASWAKTAADVVRQVARAVAHAHGRDVLHRDIKPSNVLLCADGRALLFDFGLATSAEGPRLTRTGVRLGSLAYMAPEQIDGQTDEQTDVFGLAITLYELLTLELPYGPSGGEALTHAVRAGAVVAPRHLCPEIPADLETVVLVGLERDRSRRYPTAAAFAEDLTRVLELRPIAASRPGPLTRLSRWARRHPAASVGLAAAVLLAVVAPTAWLVQERRAARQVAAALERADRNLEQALEAVDRMLLRVGDRTLAEVPAAATAREALLRDAVEFYEGFLAQNAADPRLAAEGARASTKLAWALWQLGQHERAQEASRRATELAEQHLAHNAGPDALVLWARAADPGLRAAKDRGDLAALGAGLEPVLARLLTAADGAPEHRDLGVAAATALDLRASLAAANGDAAAAEADLVAAAQRLQGLMERNPKDAPLWPRVAMAQNNLGHFLLAAGRAPEAIAPLRSAREWTLAALPSREDASAATAELASSEANLGAALLAAGELEEGQGLLGEAVARLEPLVDAMPERRDWRLALANALSRRAQAMERGGQHIDAIPLHQRHVELARTTHMQDQSSPEGRVALAMALANHAACLRALGDHSTAEALALEALDVYTALGTIRAKDRLLVRTLFQHLARARLAQGDHAGAASAAVSHVTALGNDGNDVRMAAGILVASVALVEADAELSPEDRDAQIELRMEKALDWLGAAAKVGRLSRADLERAGDFAYLRGRPDFEDLATRVLGDG